MVRIVKIVFTFTMMGSRCGSTGQSTALCNCITAF